MSLNCPCCGAELSLRLAALSLNGGLAAASSNGLATAATTAATQQTAASTTANAAANDVAGKVLDLGSKPRTQPRRRKNDYTDPAFLRFWEVYPLRREKAAAYRAFMRYVVDAGVDVDAVVAAAAAYRDDPRRDPDYTKYPQGWLSGQRWEDETAADKPPLPIDDRYKPWDPDTYLAEVDEHVAALLTEDEG